MLGTPFAATVAFYMTAHLRGARFQRAQENGTLEACPTARARKLSIGRRSMNEEVNESLK
jgi:hypothetical protein